MTMAKIRSATDNKNQQLRSWNLRSLEIWELWVWGHRTGKCENSESSGNGNDETTKRLGTSSSKSEIERKLRVLGVENTGKSGSSGSGDTGMEHERILNVLGVEHMEEAGSFWRHKNGHM